MEKDIFRSPDISQDKSYLSPRMKVGVVGSSRGAGASYVSSCILQKGPFNQAGIGGIKTLAELGLPYFYVALGMEKRFAGREFYSMKSFGPVKENREMGYNWCLQKPGDLPLTTQEKFRAVYGAPGNLVVFDFSGMQKDPDLFLLLGEMDCIYLVLDPLPSRLLESRVLIEKITDTFPNAEIVINKFSKGIHRAQLSRFLGLTDYHVLDAVPMENFYSAEYNCTLVKPK